MNKVHTDLAVRFPAPCYAQSAEIIILGSQLDGLVSVIRICLVVETSKHVVFIGFPLLECAAVRAHSLDLIQSLDERPVFVAYDVSETYPPVGTQRGLSELAQYGLG